MVVATIGDPKIIFLDEPTTGMDPVNRRHVWGFIEVSRKENHPICHLSNLRQQNFKAGRVMVLTTHSMEEADVVKNTHRVWKFENTLLTSIPFD